jgi:hypothetical protein
MEANIPHANSGIFFRSAEDICFCDEWLPQEWLAKNLRYPSVPVPYCRKWRLIVEISDAGSVFDIIEKTSIP